MSFRYYYADRIREKMPEFKGTDEELQSAIDDISLLYNSAIREVETRLSILSDDFDKKHSYMPIHHVQSRLKTFESIMEKAGRYGIEDPLNNLGTVMREILDIAGVEGNGQNQLAQALTATGSFQSGSIKLLGQEIRGMSVSGIRSLGVSHIPEDRMTVGIAPRLSITENCVIDKIGTPEFSDGLFLKKSMIREYGERVVKQFKILCKSLC